MKAWRRWLHWCSRYDTVYPPQHACSPEGHAAYNVSLAAQMRGGDASGLRSVPLCMTTPCGGGPGILCRDCWDDATVEERLRLSTEYVRRYWDDPDHAAQKVVDGVLIESGVLFGPGWWCYQPGDAHHIVVYE